MSYAAFDLKRKSAIENRLLIKIDTSKGAGATSTSGFQLLLPALNTSFSLYINWGDNTRTIANYSSTSQVAVNHTYAQPGIYTLEILTNSDRDNFAQNADSIKILEINHNSRFKNFSFTNCPSLTKVLAKDNKIRTVGFFGCTNFNQNINSWKVKEIVITGCFSNCTNFNQPLNNWDLSLCTSLYHFFLRASNFNQQIGNWNIGLVNTLQSTFEGATNFNQPLNDWDVGNVTNMLFLFWKASNFNQPLNNWASKIGKVTTMQGAFRDAIAFNQDISSWVTYLNINVNLDSFMMGKSSANYNYQFYDNWLIAMAARNWSARSAAKLMHFGTIKYSSAAVSARNTLVAAGWTITDGGMI